MPEAEVRIAETPGELEAAGSVRRRVFVEEQGVPENEEYDEYDAGAVHAVAVAGGAVVATGRLFLHPSGEARIGRMAVDMAWRRRGIGGRVLRLLEEEARRRGIERTALHAQTYVEAFYRRHGYRAAGEPFMEAGIEHVSMTKVLGGEASGARGR